MWRPASCTSARWRVRAKRLVICALSFRKVSAVGLEPVGPSMRTGLTIDQLDIDLNLVAHTPHATFQDIADPQLAADLLCINGFALIGKGGVAGYYKAVGNP